MKIYFAGSIRGGRNDKELYIEIINLLKTYGTVLTEHIGNPNITVFGEADISEEAIYDMDMKWLSEADVMVAEVTTPSLGVGYEIARAEDHIPVLCLYRPQEGKRLSAMLTGNKKLKIAEYTEFTELKSIVEEFLAEK